MRVLAAYSETYPNGMAMTYRLHCYAKGLKENRVSIHVVTPRTKNQEKGNFFCFKGCNDNVDYTIIFNKSFEKYKLLKYFLKELDAFILLAYCFINIRKYDIFWFIKFGVIPSLICIPILHFFGKKVIIEVNENPYKTVGSKITRLKWVNRLLRKITFNWIYPQIDGFIVISENLRELIIKKLKKSPLIIKIPILINYNENKISNIDNSLPTNNPYLFHAGSLSEKKDGIIEVLKAYALACKLLEPKISLDFVITNRITIPETWKKIQDIIVENKLEDKIIFTGYVSNDKMYHLLNNAAVSIINKPVNDQNLYNFPTKIGDYLKCGVPIVVGAKNMELITFLINDVNSIITEPNDIIAISNGVIRLLSNDEFNKKISAAGIQMAKDQFSYHIHGPRMSFFLNRVFKS